MAARARVRSRSSLPSSTAILRQAMAKAVSSVTASSSRASPRSPSPASSASSEPSTYFRSAASEGVVTRSSSELARMVRSDSPAFARTARDRSPSAPMSASSFAAVSRKVASSWPSSGRDQPRRDHVALSQPHDLAVEHRLGALAGGDLARQLERHDALRRALHEPENLAHRGAGQDLERAGLGQVGAQRLGDGGPERGVAGGRPESATTTVSCAPKAPLPRRSGSRSG